MNTKYKDESFKAERGPFEMIQAPVRPGEADVDQLLQDLLQGGRIYSLRRHYQYLSQGARESSWHRRCSIMIPSPTLPKASIDSLGSQALVKAAD